MSLQQNYYSYQPSRPSQSPLRYRKKRWGRLLGLCAFTALLSVCAIDWQFHDTKKATSANAIVSASTAKTANTPLVSAASAEEAKLQSAWATALAGYQGDVDIAVYNSKTGITSHYSNASTRFNTASIVKLSILETVLLQDQHDNSGLTEGQLALAAPMIENSDDDSASELWSDIGAPSSINSFFKQIGATSTGAPNAWGLTQTTALDQLKVVNQIAYPGTVLSQASADSANDLLQNVESDQSWGVSAGTPDDVTVLLKNGWLEDDETNDPYSNTDDWTMNSIGHVFGEGQDYTIAVLTQGDPSQYLGINTIQQLAAITWQTLAAG